MLIFEFLKPLLRGAFFIYLNDSSENDYSGLFIRQFYKMIFCESISASGGITQSFLLNVSEKALKF